MADKDTVGGKIDDAVDDVKNKIDEAQGMWAKFRSWKYSNYVLIGAGVLLFLIIILAVT